MILLLVYAACSILFSFLCSILEAVLLSITPTFLNLKKKEGLAYATSLERLKKDVDQPLIAILTLNTFSHTVGAILVGVQAEQLPYKIEFLGVNIVGIISSAMTLLILVVSEIIPKTIGASYWKQLANFTSKSLLILIFPLKYSGILPLLRLTTRLISKTEHGSVLSREDFTAMTEIAEREGVFQTSESTVIKNLLNFKEVRVHDIMTPRTVLKTADERQTIQDFFDKNPIQRFSRIPIYSENPDNITGYFLKDELLEAIIKGNGGQSLKNIKRSIVITQASLPIPNLFERLIDQKEHIALVVDEYGAVGGLVTQEDVIETLLGLEIMDESDTVENLQQMARKSWERRARRLGILTDFNQETSSQ